MALLFSQMDLYEKVETTNVNVVNPPKSLYATNYRYIFCWRDYDWLHDRLYLIAFVTVIINMMLLF